LITGDEWQWQAIGNQAKIAREQLFALHRLASPNMPKAIVQFIGESIEKLDVFRHHAENRMFATNQSDNLNVTTFYGPIQSEEGEISI